LNNKGYGFIRNTQKKFFNSFFVVSDLSSGLSLPDINNISKAYGIKTIEISKNNELRTKVKEVLKTEGPVVSDVLVDPYEPTMPKVTSLIKPDDTMVSKPLEDLWPCLEREELKNNMIVKPMEEK
jgi:acetolactate synthase-1/2/3 large subunit